MSSYHLPVMAREVLEGLNLKAGGIYFDGTAGGGGHSLSILTSKPTIKLIATDKDAEAIEETDRRLQPYRGRYSLYRSDFKDFEKVFKAEKIEKIDGFLLDLGVSSHQIDDERRGFSYRMKDAPLDMRMDQSNPFSAKDVVNGYSEERIRKILREYGEEMFSQAIARNIVRYREKKEITTCGELEELVMSGIPAKYRTPVSARRCFQAIRIEVNGELSGLGDCVGRLVKRLKKDGRGCILTFHSLEDRIVKQTFRSFAAECTCPKDFPVCVCGKTKEIELVGRFTASEEEIKENPRSKSAKLRVIRKISE